MMLHQAKVDAKADCTYKYMSILRRLLTPWSAFALSLGLAKQCCLLLIRAYQLTVSVVLPPACRYYPSCSSYCQDAVKMHGVFKGSFLGLKRLLRCHPWGQAGYDPVPQKTDRRIVNLDLRKTSKDLGNNDDE